MQTQISILDYDLTATASGGWAKVGLFGQLIDGEYSGQKVEFQFTQEDAVTAAIEMGFLEQPDDRDKDRVGYENPAWSATVRESFDYAKRIQYQTNTEAMREFSGTDFAEQIVRRLTLQAPEVREVIQAEALRIALAECPMGMVETKDLIPWFDSKHQEFFGMGVDYGAISEYMKNSYYAAEAETLNQL